MGVSSDGLLLFGFPLGNEDENPFDHLLQTDAEGDKEEFDDLVAREAGVEPWTEDRAKERYQRKSNAVEACPVALDIYCSYDYPMYFLSINKTKKRVYRGETLGLPLESLEVPEVMIEAAKEWCEKHGVEWKTPQWHLASLYG